MSTVKTGNKTTGLTLRTKVVIISLAGNITQIMFGYYFIS
jgi:hypothetical protein